MLPMHAPLAIGAVRSVARAALPDAPVQPAPAAAEVAAPRRALADGLRTLADRLAPEPVERSRWQSG